jgi:hypothetical protein
VIEDAEIAMTMERRSRGTSYTMVMPMLIASMATKCIDQMPVPIAKALPAIHRRRRPPLAAATLEDMSSAVYPAREAMTTDATTRRGSYV